MKTIQVKSIKEFLKTISPSFARNIYKDIRRGFFHHKIVTYSRLVSSNRHIENIDTICILVGPYRNLTTITAAFFHLHPNCQVLNHAGLRILHNPYYDFLNNPSQETLRKFYRFAVAASQGGKRGQFGGSITLAHAFDRDILNNKHVERYDDKLLKDDIRALLWKESHRISNHLENVNLKNVLNQLPQVKFILPIRNPIDTAMSNIHTAHYKFFPQLKDYHSKDVDEYTVLELTMKELNRFIDLCLNYPDNGIYFFQYDMSKDLLAQLADFAGLSRNDQWMNDILEVWKTPLAKYEYSQEILNMYINLVEKYYSDKPLLHEKFMHFLNYMR